MKKTRKSSKKGFTLVELIVVLVILAILAAMLVPALTGYIRRAREEKDYQFAATVLTAAQSAAAYQYAQPGFNSATAITESTSAGKSANDTVSGLVGNTNFQCNFTVDSNAVIKYDGTGWVYVNGAIYYLQSGGSWSAVSSSAAPSRS